MKNPTVSLIAIALLAACCPPQATLPPRTTLPAATPSPTPTPPPTLTPIPTLPTIPSWSPYQPDGPTGWCWQEVMGLVNTLNDVFFWDAQTGWAVGEKGTILHTDNGGETWQRQESPLAASLDKVTFVDAQTGWILGASWPRSFHKEFLLHTKDGGQTWMQQDLPIPEDIIDTAWSDASTGWLVTEYYDFHVFHTTDGGKTWQRQTLPPSESYVESITCTDSLHAWIAARDTIFRTADGGKTWTTQYPGLDAVTLVTFIDAQTGWAFGGHNRAIAKTANGGQTWQVQQAQMNSVQDAQFLDPKTGWALSYGSLLATTDGGITWENSQAPRDRQALVFIDDQHGWAVGGTGRDGSGERITIAHTYDGGNSWQVQDLNIEMPPEAHTAAARLSAYLTQPDPPVEALLLRLFQAPCFYSKQDWIETLMRNLGWDGSRWGDPPTTPSSLSYDWHKLEPTLKTDLDRDGVDEIILYGNVYPELFVGVLDWDGSQWQVAWFDTFPYYHGGEIKVHIDDFDSDDRQDLLIATIVSGHTGYFRDLSLTKCNHLNCRTVWSADAGFIGGGFQDGFDYTVWSSEDYTFTTQDSQPEIKSRSYGAQYRVAEDEAGVHLETLEVRIMTSTQTIYRWDDSVYTPTMNSVITPGYTLDTGTVTETLDLNRDGKQEMIVSRWSTDRWDLQQSLTIYTLDDEGTWQSAQAFTATIMAQSAGISLEDVNGDGQLDIVQCTNAFPSTITLDTWPTLEPPVCTIYRWDPAARAFVPEDE